MSLITGRACALTFGTTTSFTPKISQIGGFGWSRPSIDTSYLGTVGTRTYKGGDLYALDPVTASIFVESDEFATTDDCSIADILFDTGAAAASESAITLTLSDSGAATLAAAGHITGFSIDDIVLDQLVTGSVSYQWDLSPTIAE